MAPFHLCPQNGSLRPQCEAVLKDKRKHCFDNCQIVRLGGLCARPITLPNPIPFKQGRKAQELWKSQDKGYQVFHWLPPHARAIPGFQRVSDHLQTPKHAPAALLGCSSFCLKHTTARLARQGCHMSTWHDARDFFHLTHRLNTAQPKTVRLEEITGAVPGTHVAPLRARRAVACFKQKELQPSKAAGACFPCLKMV